MTLAKTVRRLIKVLQVVYSLTTIPLLCLVREWDA
jgi:hypothetical protein